MTPTIILGEDDLVNREMDPTLVDELFIQGTTCFIVSDAGVGKSFIALDLALSIAAGLPSFLGFPLHTEDWSSRAVLYVLGEGAGRFGLRIKAWKNFHNIIANLPFFWTNGPVDLMDEDAVDGFIEAIKEMELPPTLIVFDTFSRCVAGAEENGQAEMSTAIKHIDRIRTTVPGLTVLVLHHMNANGQRERGSTVLKAAIETQLLIEKLKENGQPRLKISTIKQKDLDQRNSFKLQMNVVETGDVEATGTLATSIVWTRINEVAAKVEESTEPTPQDQIEMYVREHPNCNKSEVAAFIGGRKTTVFDMIETLVEEGRLKSIPRGLQHLLSIDTTSSLSHSFRSVGEGNYVDGRVNGSGVGTVEQAQIPRLVKSGTDREPVPTGQNREIVGNRSGNRTLKPLEYAKRVTLFRVRDERDDEHEDEED